jgi:DNA-binding LacI/PurR family transcriptional regulator
MDRPLTPQRISLRDIGRLANLSHSTVSLALRNHPSIAAKTRKRVRDLAASLGYVPDPMLRALAEYRRDKAVRQYQGSLAWINNHPDPHALDARHEFTLYRQGAEERAAELGYKLVTFSPAVEKIPSAALRRILLNSGIRGLLFPPQPQSHTALDFDFTNFSALAFGFSISVPQLHVVTNCQFRSSIIAVRQMRSRGYKRLGFIISEALNERSEGNFLGGFLAEQNKLSAKERIPVFISRTGFTDEENKKFRRWFETYQPDALIADFFEWTIAYLQNLGLRVPEDIPLAILGVVPQLRRYAGVDQNDRKIGQLGVDTLVGMIYRNETGVPEIPTRILVEGQWQDGESVPMSKFTSVS